jgi:diguanylate cyclase (GGDEF)-like protein
LIRGVRSKVEEMGKGVSSCLNSSKRQNHFSNLFLNEAHLWLAIFFIVEAFVTLYQSLVFHLGDRALDILVATVALCGYLTVSKIRRKATTTGFIYAAIGAATLSSYLAYLDTNGELSAILVLTYAWLALVLYSVLSFRQAMLVSFAMVLLYSLGLGLGNGFGPGLSTWIPVLAVLVVGGVFVSRVISRLGEFAYIDELTGLPNRRFLIMNLTREIKAARRLKTPLSVAIVDLDDFKVLNDSLGHVAGDKALVDLAYAWSSSLRGRDFIARYGGDEFVVVMPECNSTQAESVLKRILSATQSISGASFGVAEWDRKSTIEELLMSADSSLYECKRKRRANGVASQRNSVTPMGSSHMIDLRSDSIKIF